MEMTLNKTIEKLVAKIKITQGRTDNILAFGELHIFESNQENPIIKVKGFTIRNKKFRDKEITAVTFPAFRAGIKYQTSFILEDKDLWVNVVKLFLDEFTQQTGDVNRGQLDEPKIDLDEVDKELNKQNKF